MFKFRSNKYAFYSLIMTLVLVINVLPAQYNHKTAQSKGLKDSILNSIVKGAKISPDLFVEGYGGGPGNGPSDYFVNTTDDTIDSNVGNGQCSDNSGNCSIRAAVMENNYWDNNQYNVPTIHIPAGTYTLTRSLDGLQNDDTNQSYGMLKLLKAVHLLGNTATNTILQAGTDTDNHMGGILWSYGEPNGSNTALNVSNLTLQHGNTANYTSDNGGGGGAAHNGYGGAILASTDLTLNNVIVQNNVANFGAGIYGIDDIHINNSIIRNNTATTDHPIQYYENGVPFGSGSAILANYKLSVTNSTISGNTGFRGTIYLDSNNCFDNGCTYPSVSNSTISNNSVTQSGAVFQQYYGPSALLINITAANNTAGENGYMLDYQVNGSANPRPFIRGTNNIFYNPGQYTCSSGNANDYLFDTSIFNDNTCFNAFNSNFYNSNPNLGSLTDNGGSTPTMSISSSSIANDSAIHSIRQYEDSENGFSFPGINFPAIPNDVLPTVDQRGVERHSDIGAYEYNAGDPVSCNSSTSGANNNNGGTASVTVNLGVCAGALTIATSTPLNLSGLSCSTTDQNSNGTSGTITITDTSGAFAGWSATSKFSNMAGQNDSSKVVRLASDSTFDGNTAKYLTVIPSQFSPSTGSSANITNYDTLQDITSLDGITSSGLSSPFSVASATTGNGAGLYTGDVSASMTIPSYCRYPDDGQILPQAYKGTMYVFVS